MAFPNELIFGGDWKITVTTQNSSNQQRFTTSGSANDATVTGTVGQVLNVTAKLGQSWSLRIENRVGTGPWNPSSMLMGPVTQAGGLFTRTIYAEDLAGGSSLDFDDLVLTFSRVDPSPLFLDAKDVFEIPQFARGVELRTQLRDEKGRAISLSALELDELTVLFTLAWVEGPTVLLIRADGAMPPDGDPRPGPGVGRIVDANKGIIGYTVQADDFQRTGRYEGEFWVSRDGPPGMTEPLEAFAYPVRRKLDIRVFKTVGGNLFPVP
jgi:hypothetical protein